jgi:hypothetical protein
VGEVRTVGWKDGGGEEGKVKKGGENGRKEKEKKLGRERKAG